MPRSWKNERYDENEATEEVLERNDWSTCAHTNLHSYYILNKFSSSTLTSS